MSTQNLTMRTIAAFVSANVPVLIEGEPGQSKTAKLTASLKAAGYDVFVVIGALRDPQDFLGQPYEADGMTEYTPPGWAVRANRSEKAVVIFDELRTTTPATFKAMLRVLEERYAGDLRLGDHVRLLAISNPTETSVDGYDLPPPMANRMGHLSWAFDSDEWMENVISGFRFTEPVAIPRFDEETRLTQRAAAGAMVTGFLAHRPDRLAPAVPTDPVRAGVAWPSPRTWTKVIDVLSGVNLNDTALVDLVVTALVGDGDSKMMRAWLLTADLVPPARLLEDPTLVAWSSVRADQALAMLSGVAALAMTRGTAKIWEQAMNVVLVAARQNKVDVAVPAVRQLLNPAFRPQGSRVDMTEVRTVFGDVFTRMDHGFTMPATQLRSA